MSEVKAPPPEEQRKILDDYLAISKPTQINEKWAVIERGWFDTWKLYVGLKTTSSPSKKEPKPPGAINNEKLIVQGGSADDFKKLILYLTAEDYVLVKKEAYDKLHEWYGGGPEIIRNSIYHTHMNVEIYPLLIKVYPPRTEESENKEEVEERVAGNFLISKHITFGSFYKRVGSFFKLSEPYELWFSLNDRPYRVLRLSKLRQERLSSIVRRTYDQVIEVVIPEKQKNELNDAQFELDTAKQSWSSIYRNKQSELRGGKPDEKVPTCCGLKNLGNTCYLSSSIQCLSRLESIHPYFRDQNMWKGKLNLTNPLGLGGKMVRSFSRTLRQMWEEKWGYLFPREVKYVIQRFNPVYEGARQQDVSEFSQDLLRALHEDLRESVSQEEEDEEEDEGEEEKSSPSVTMVPSVAENAEKSWEHFFNVEGNSIINKTFYGQFRTEKMCQQCSKVKTNFQPFLILHMPIPDTGPSLPIRFVWYNNRKTPEKITIQGADQIMAGVLKTHLEDLLRVPNERMVLVVDDKILLDHELVKREGEDGNSRIYVYEMLNLKEGSSPVVTGDVEYLMVRVKTGNEVEVDPFFIQVSKGDTKHRDLFSQCLKHMWHYVGSQFKSGAVSGAGATVEPKVDSIFQDFGIDYLKKTPLFRLHHNNSNMTQILYGEDFFKLEDEEILREGLNLEIPPDAWISYDKSRFTYYSERIKYVGDVLDLEKLILNLKAEQTVQYKCLKCGHEKSTEKIDLWRLPKVLLLSFSRFKTDEKTAKNVKIQSFIDFPIQDFQMGKYSGNVMNRNMKYNLRGVCDHIGSALNCGHYTSNVKFLNKDKEVVWMRVNNARYDKIDERDIKSNNAYLLFYELVEE